MRFAPFVLLFFLFPSYVLADTAMQDALRMLASRTPSQRVTALRKMAQFPPDLSASEPLLDSLKDSSAVVRIIALKTWARIAPAFNDYMREKANLLRLAGPERDRAYETFDGWQNRLIAAIGTLGESEDATEGREAVRCLATLGTDVEVIMPPVETRCGSGRELRLDLKASEELLRVAPLRPQRIVSLLSDKEPNVVFNAAFALNEVDHALVVQAVRPYLYRPRPEWKAIGLNFLSGEEWALEDILPFLADENNCVREAAVVAVKYTMTQETRPRLLRQMANAYEAAGPAMRRSILALVEKEYVPNYSLLILEACQDQHGDVCGDALDRTKRDELTLPLPVLVFCLHHQSVSVRLKAISLLVDREPKEAKRYLIPMLSDRSKEVVKAAIDGCLPFAEVRQVHFALLKTLVTAFRRSKLTDQTWLTFAISNNDPQVKSMVRVLLADPDWRMRALAAGAAGTSLGEEAIPSLLKLAKDSHAKVRCQVIDGMKDKAIRGDTRINEALLALLKDPDSIVRGVAIFAFEAPYDPRFVEILRGMAEDPNPYTALLANRVMGWVMKELKSSL